MLREMANRKYCSLSKQTSLNVSPSPIQKFKPKKMTPITTLPPKKSFNCSFGGYNSPSLITKASTSKTTIAKDNSNSLVNHQTLPTSTTNKVKYNKSYSKLQTPSSISNSTRSGKSPSKKTTQLTKSSSMKEMNLILSDISKPNKDILQNNKKHKKSKSIEKNDYYKNMESMLNGIKQNGIEKYHEIIEERIQLKKDIENSINNLKQKIHMYKSKAKYWDLENEKVLMQILQIKTVSDRYKSMNYELDIYHKNTPNYQKELKTTKNETILIEKEINQINEEINLLKDDIKKMNKKIFNVEKENDNLRNSLMITKKQCNLLKTKLETTNQNNNEVMLTMTSIFNKSNNNQI